MTNTITSGHNLCFYIIRGSNKIKVFVETYFEFENMYICLEDWKRLKKNVGSFWSEELVPEGVPPKNTNARFLKKYMQLSMHPY